MRNFISRMLIAALLALSYTVGTMTAAQAFTWNGLDHAFCENGLRSPEELAAKLERSLKLKPDGTGDVEGCLAKPLAFLTGFQLADPKAVASGQLRSLEDLPGYVRQLVEMKVLDSEFRTTSIRILQSGRQEVHFKTERAIRDGEKVYGNPKTGIGTLMSSCANPGAVPVQIVVEAACYEILIKDLPIGTKVRYAYAGPELLSPRCHEITVAGEQEPRLKDPNDCPMGDRVEIRNGMQVTVVCNWKRPLRAAAKLFDVSIDIQNRSGSFVTQAVGTTSIRVPQDVRNGIFMVCIEESEERGGRSMSQGVRKQHYVDKVAVMTYDHFINNPYTGTE